VLVLLAFTDDRILLAIAHNELPRDELHSLALSLPPIPPVPVPSSAESTAASVRMREESKAGKIILVFRSRKGNNPLSPAELKLKDTLRAFIAVISGEVQIWYWSRLCGVHFVTLLAKNRRISVRELCTWAARTLSLPFLDSRNMYRR